MCPWTHSFIHPCINLSIHSVVYPVATHSPTWSSPIHLHIAGPLRWCIRVGAKICDVASIYISDLESVFQPRGLFMKGPMPWRCGCKRRGISLSHDNFHPTESFVAMALTLGIWSSSKVLWHRGADENKDVADSTRTNSQTNNVWYHLVFVCNEYGAMAGAYPRIVWWIIFISWENQACAAGNRSRGKAICKAGRPRLALTVWPRSDHACRFIRAPFTSDVSVV